MMIRKNVFELPKLPVVAHHGEGLIQFSRPFEDQDFETGLSFVDYVEIPPGASIGVHTHGDNEEIYFIVKGAGRMHVNGEENRVNAGDLIVNRRGGTHGLHNDTGDPIQVLVWEVACRSSS